MSKTSTNLLGIGVVLIIIFLGFVIIGHPLDNIESMSAGTRINGRILSITPSKTNFPFDAIISNGNNQEYYVQFRIDVKDSEGNVYDADAYTHTRISFYAIPAHETIRINQGDLYVANGEGPLTIIRCEMWISNKIQYPHLYIIAKIPCDEP